ncbi:hypothetical protein P4C99_03445 [Pontiellaceae bacterium B1224]|nr:hypothetical protein [Pontiellaceae bacterium B1224]
MKTYTSDAKLNHSIQKIHLFTRKHKWPHVNWVPFAVIVLTGLISYLVYALCSTIPVMAPHSTGIWQLFG